MGVIHILLERNEIIVFYIASLIIYLQTKASTQINKFPKKKNIAPLL